MAIFDSELLLQYTTLTYFLKGTHSLPLAFTKTEYFKADRPKNQFSDIINDMHFYKQHMNNISELTGYDGLATNSSIQLE